MKILIIDDYENDLNKLDAVLTEMGHIVQTRRVSGFENDGDYVDGGDFSYERVIESLRQLIASFNPDIIMLDESMGDYRGTVIGEGLLSDGFPKNRLVGISSDKDQPYCSCRFSKKSQPKDELGRLLESFLMERFAT